MLLSAMEPSEASWQRGGTHSPISAMYRCSFFTHRTQYKVLHDLGQCPQGRLKEGRYDVHEIQITQLGMGGLPGSLCTKKTWTPFYEILSLNNWLRQIAHLNLTAMAQRSRRCGRRRVPEEKRACLKEISPRHREGKEWISTRYIIISD